MSPIGFLLGVMAGVVATERTDLAPWLAVRLVRWAARHRYTDPERAAIRAEEHQAVIADRPTRLLKLATALGFAAAATGAITNRRARHVVYAARQTRYLVGRVRKVMQPLITASSALWSSVSVDMVAALTVLSGTLIIATLMVSKAFGLGKGYAFIFVAVGAIVGVGVLRRIWRHRGDGRSE
ncbi:hypothetical protein ACRYCC_26170 [Actinomadura scrupuli]|uniref:hypothetical protein n=1 Tax=Actinomadura scrupuli TaxID=559629 RepID=UPI003D968640